MSTDLTLLVKALNITPNTSSESFVLDLSDVYKGISKGIAVLNGTVSAGTGENIAAVANLHGTQSPWPAVFKALSFGAQFPLTDVSKVDLWMDVLLQHAWVPIVLFVLGSVIALSVMYCLLPCGKKESVSKAPSKIPLLFFLVLTLLVTWGGYCSTLVWTQKGVAEARNLWDEVKGDLTQSRDLVDNVLQDVNQTLISFIALPESCNGPIYESTKWTASWVNIDIEKQLKALVGSVQPLLEMLQWYFYVDEHILDPLALKMDEIEKHQSLGTLMNIVVMGPALIVSVICLLIIMGAFCTSSSPCLARFMEIQAVPLCLTIFIMSAFCAFLLMIGIFLGTFCAEPESIVLQVANQTLTGIGIPEFTIPNIPLVWGGGATLLGRNWAYDVVAYYLTGEGTNILQDDLNAMKEYGMHLQSTFGSWWVEKLWNFFKGLAAMAVCKDISKLDLLGVLTTAVDSTDTISGFLEREKIYGCYD